MESTPFLGDAQRAKRAEEQLVICNDEDTDGRARVTAYE